VKGGYDKSHEVKIPYRFRRTPNLLLLHGYIAILFLSELSFKS